MEVDNQRYEQQKHEIRKAHYALKTNYHNKLTLRQKQEYEVSIQLKRVVEEMNQIHENEKMYKEILLERRRYLTYKNIEKNSSDVEMMVKQLYTHFEIIRKTCFSAMAKENYTGVGSFQIITESSKELKRLEKELKQFSIPKSDLRYTLYNMIIVMLNDNIQMRLWINDLMKNQIDEAQRKLEGLKRSQADSSQRNDTEGSHNGRGGRKDRQNLSQDEYRSYGPSSQTNRGADFGSGYRQNQASRE